MKNRTLWIVTISAMIIGLFFGRIWFNRLRLDYNLNGRYFDKSSSVVYDEDSVFGYGILALFLEYALTYFILKLKLVVY